MKRLRQRCLGDIAEDIRLVTDDVLSFCVGKVSDAKVVMTQISALETELSETRNQEQSEEQDDERDILKMRLDASREVIRLKTSKGGEKVMKSVEVQTETNNVGGSGFQTKKTKTTTPTKYSSTFGTFPSLTPTKAGMSPRASPRAQPQLPPSPSAGPADIGVTLGEGQMVRIGTEIVFAVMKSAIRDKHICSLSELFIECDKNGDGGISFTELLNWVKGPLQVSVTDWQLDEFGRRLHWERACNIHPQNFIDQKGFLKIMKEMWIKVKWYFNNSVIYGVSQQSVKRSGVNVASLTLADLIREAMYNLMKSLIVSNCHIHTFFAIFDSDRKQKLTQSELVSVFSKLETETGVKCGDPLELSRTCCSIANSMYEGVEDKDDEITLFQLQDLMREFFVEFSVRFELSILSEEVRAKFIFRNIIFGACGVIESSHELEPIHNVFSLFSKYAVNGTLTAEAIRSMLRNEFYLFLTPSEVLQLMDLSDANHDHKLDLMEFSRLLTIAFNEMTDTLQARFPAGFVPNSINPPKLTPGTVGVLAKLIHRLLQTDETVDDFFTSLPRFGPTDFVSNNKEGSRTPEEILLGMRRLGVAQGSAATFEGWGSDAVEGWTGFRWGPAKTLLDSQQFKQGLWAVWSQFIAPTFLKVNDWQSEANAVSSKYATALADHLQVPSPRSSLDLWAALPKPLNDALHVHVTSLLSLLEKIKTVYATSRPTLVSTTVLKCEAKADFKSEFLQLLRTAQVSQTVTKEQFLSLFPMLQQR
eukprot:TRINITY_DN12473_c0_g1_i1.p1 TRINITY_DN12473_c0_g1~~TRINITY_DN12473_c0_g1_i1.p1  ORF type:complete len:759 (+),score=164.01 TRINITY_DN12473_c0_g1_i1:68-2344(+)